MSGRSFNQQQATTPSPECHLSIHRVTQDGSGRDIVEHDHRTSPRDLSIQWSSVDRNLSVTPSDNYNQIQPTKDHNRYTAAAAVPATTTTTVLKDGQQTLINTTGHEHKMVLDGSDAYTLVILDCSPHPDSRAGECSTECMSRSGSCDCHAKCYCQTELIIKQQQIPHDHVCQHVCHHYTNHQQHQEQQHQEQQQQQQHQRGIQQHHQNHENYLSIEQNRSPNSTRGNNSSRGSDFGGPDSQQRQEYYQNQQQVNSAHEIQHHSPNEQQFVNTHEQQNWKGIDHDNNSFSQLSQSQQLQKLAQDEAKSLKELERERQLQEQQQRQHQQQQQDQRNQKNREQQLGLLRQKGATKLVKRWDWNQAQFVEQEVPVEQAQRPQIGPFSSSSPSSQITHSTTDIWHQDMGVVSKTIPTTATTTSSSLIPSTSSASNSTQLGLLIQPPPPPPPQSSNTEQPWLERRIPDIQSVQSDPLYRDLLFELQRLEEGVSAPPIQTNINEQENQLQRPVFGQSITPEHVEVKEYENVEFVCRLIPNSDPTINIQWTLNGKLLQESSRITNEHDFGVVRLLIKRCEAEDSGIYQCKASNSLGEAISTASLRVHAKGNIQCETLHPAGLDKIRQLENPKPVDNIEEQPIEQAPKFLTHIQDYVEKGEGESVHFECCLAPVDDPDLKTEWFFNGRPLVTGSRFHTIDDFGFIVLDIDWLFPRDTGEYVCRATNKFGSDITRTVLRVKPDKNIVLDSQLDNPMIIDKLRLLEFPNVQQESIIEEPDKPAHFVQQLKSENNRQQFNEGDNVHFEARVGPATDGNLTVEWFHNDKPLINGHRFKPSFDFGHIQLDILYVYPEDSGIYKCITRNSTGVDVSQFEINVQGKPSLILKSQLPKEMEGGVQKINEMEAMWNRPIEPEEDEAPREKLAPEFVLKPKPYTAFEGNSARFCCRIIGFPKPRLTWVVNGQTVVTGSRYKLTYDGMYHLIIPKCQLSDAGKIEVYARNLSGECFSTTELKVTRKVDDYRGVLKNSPNPWYDEQSLKVYQRHRSSQDLTDDDNDYDEYFQQYQSQRLQMATEQQSISPITNQVIGYMEPGTPDVNLLATSKSPLMEPGDLHPVVVERQVVMAPPPSTIQKAIKVKDSIQAPDKSLTLPELRGGASAHNQQHQQQTNQEYNTQQDLTATTSQQRQQQQQQRQQQRVFGVDLPRYSPHVSSDETKKQLYDKNKAAQVQPYHQQVEYQEWLIHQQQLMDQQQQQQSNRSSEEKFLRERQQSPGQSSLYDARLPPPSPESMVHGKEVHSHTHKQTQLERRRNKEIIREIIEKDIFEQEHKGVTKDNIMRGSSAERGSTPDSIQSSSLRDEMMNKPSRSSANYNAQLQQQEQQLLLLQQQQEAQQQQQVHFQDEQQVLIEDYMVPPEFIQKIQPCQAIDGDEAHFECTFKGDPKPNISWFRETKLIKPSNMYTIITDLNNENFKSTLIIKRVTLNSNAVYTVKAENAAGSAKSSANLVVEPHPLAEQNKGQVGGGVARTMDNVVGQHQHQHQQNKQSSSSSSQVFQASSSSNFGPSTTMATVKSGNISTDSGVSKANLEQQDLDSSQSDSQSNKVVKSIKTRKLHAQEMGDLIRASPEGVVAPTFLHTIHDISSKSGELARLDARLIGSQPMEVRWLKDDQRIRADKSHKMVLEGDLYTLLILECSQRDEGFYECIACNRVGEARCGAKLTIYSDYRDLSTSGASSKTPELIASSYSSSQSQSSSTMGASTTFAATSTLQTNEQQQQQGQRKFFGQTKLQFHPLMNQYTTVSPSGQLMQQEVPRLIKGLENQQVREGKAVTLRCQISSFPIPEVHWYKQGDKPIKPSKYFRIFKDNDETYCLRILETFPEDQGEYKCVARAPNSHANVETKAIITVIPNSPR